MEHSANKNLGAGAPRQTIQARQDNGDAAAPLRQATWPKSAMARCSTNRKTSQERDGPQPREGGPGNVRVLGRASRAATPTDVDAPLPWGLIFSEKNVGYVDL